MTIKTGVLAAIAALTLAAPVAALAQPYGGYEGRSGGGAYGQTAYGGRFDDRPGYDDRAGYGRSAWRGDDGRRDEWRMARERELRRLAWLRHQRWEQQQQYRGYGYGYR